MRVLKALFVRDAFLKIREPWSFLAAFVVFNVVVIAFWKHVRFTFVGSNLLEVCAELNVAFLVYMFLLCGLTALRSGGRKVFSIPVLFFPYVLTPIYAVILTWLRLPKALSFTIAFLHSILLSSEHDILILSARIATYGVLLMVVRHWV
ncbi:hypothetical protein AS159_07390 [Thermotoga sp. Ku-13t]|uniref:hypothetical protein n=1 Tax=Thermotoga sp. Ku-13t TaxID=1755813 RepID=UPI0013EBDECA|nr:hypothetical protein [Thermotoga sp. Ku-13t]KAF2957483.1 hypothetical protein AS159_07390 [Thermotoga sp. Ku-13t]